MDLKLRNKIVVVTGAASGIGAYIARSFCEEGSKTFFADINGEGLKKVIEGYPESAFPIECDVSDRSSVKRLFETVRTRFKQLHVLVNNAAVNTADFVPDIKEEDINSVYSINIKGYIYTTAQAIPLMKETGFGRLIYINSGSGLKASAGMSLYSGSKYFNRGFAISTALEAGKFNITANSICPSDVYPSAGKASGPGTYKDRTDESEARHFGAKSWTNESLVRVSLEKEGVGSLEELIRKRTAKNPMRRSCTPEDIASLALFLASEKAGFINGQSIGVNGGALPF